jgi:lipid-binding SYLF domain-containing protein
MKGRISAAMLVLGMLSSGCATIDKSSETTKLESDASAALARFQSETSGEEALLRAAKGLLICPKITKGGFIVGVEGGKCALQVGGQTVDYYSNQAGKFGLLAGVQWYSMILVFNDQAALNTFRAGKREWEVGVDASVAVAKVGATGSLDTSNLRQSIVAFTFGERGLMGDVSLQGSTFKKLEVK